MRGCLALSGVIARVTMGELRHAQPWMSLAGVLTIATSLAVITASAHVWSYGFAPGFRGLVVAKLGLCLLPQSLAFSLPLAALTPPLPRRHPSSVLGIGLLLIACAMVNLGWVLPKGIQEFRRHVRSEFAATGKSVVFPQTASRVLEMSVGELARVARSGETPTAESAARILSGRASLLVVAPVFLLVGWQAKRFAMDRGWRLPGGIFAWSIAVGAYVIGGLVGRLLPWQLTVSFIQPWLLIAAALLIALWLARDARVSNARADMPSQ